MIRVAYGIFLVLFHFQLTWTDIIGPVVVILIFIVGRLKVVRNDTLPTVNTLNVSTGDMVV